jgi:addiction module HigA family antidote
MRKLPNIHPGEILSEEFMKPLKISAYRLSKALGIPQTRTSEILNGRRSITVDTALRLSKYFGTSAKFWMGLQSDYDIEEAQKHKNGDFGKIERFNPGVHRIIKLRKVG